MVVVDVNWNSIAYQIAKFLLISVSVSNGNITFLNIIKLSSFLTVVLPLAFQKQKTKKKMFYNNSICKYIYIYIYSTPTI